jgi:hypothetical protein
MRCGLAGLVALCALLMSTLLHAEESVCHADGTCEYDVNGVEVPKGANTEGKPREAVKECLDRHSECIGFEQQGECHKNPGWMIINCPRSCNACHLRDPTIRCSRFALNMTTTPVYAPGDLNRMFESIVDRFGDKYKVNVLSTSPWVVTFDDFLTDKEVRAIIRVRSNVIH